MDSCKRKGAERNFGDRNFFFGFSKTFIDGEILAFFLLLRTLSLCEYVCLVVNRNFIRIMFSVQIYKANNCLITLATSFVCKRLRP